MGWDVTALPWQIGRLKRTYLQHIEVMPGVWLERAD
jgi:hypothetical protein